MLAIEPEPNNYRVEVNSSLDPVGCDFRVSLRTHLFSCKWGDFLASCCFIAKPGFQDAKGVVFFGAPL
jgi:hypothetical protein